MVTANIEDKIDFYARVLGMRLSDHAQDMVAFFHLPCGSDHHVQAFLANDWLKFFYDIRGPRNGLAEYFFGIDYIPADLAWWLKDWPLEDSLYVWGPDVR